MTYFEFLTELRSYAEEKLADFHTPLLNSKTQKILGVRMPVLRKIAKSKVGEVEELFSYPDEYHEVTLLKLLAVSYLPYDKFLPYADRAVALISNWAQCDCFKANCIKKHRKEFLPKITAYFNTGEEFFQRYALVTLLYDYIDENYFDTIMDFLSRADTKKYYVYMAAAWLVAELLTKEFNFGVRVLRSGVLDVKTHNKAIQKARESYRISKERKEFLSSLKIN